MAGLIDYASSVAGEAKKNVQGLLADPKQALKDILNNLALKAAAQQAATKAAWATRDPKIMAKNALDSSQTALGFAPLGITAWHGSPHKFNKFSMDKIGTGEGAQAYGHGLYLAESPAVATEYQKNLSQFSRIDGKPLVGNKTISSGARTYLLAENADLPKAIQNARDAIARKPDNELLPPILKELESLNPDSITKSSTGQLYKTDIPDEAAARFLDWDKPLSQQSKEVQAGLSKALAKRPGMTGAELYNVFGGSGALRQDLNTNFGFGKQASETLKELGIPGIRYLDEGSRNTTQRYIAKHPMGGESVFNTQPELDAFIKRNPVFKAINPNLTSNYVVFDPEMIRILERNGQATGAVPWQPGEWRGLLGNN